jgi:hypothetical protein
VAIVLVLFILLVAIVLVLLILLVAIVLVLVLVLVVGRGAIHSANRCREYV